MVSKYEQKGNRVNRDKEENAVSSITSFIFINTKSIFSQIPADEAAFLMLRHSKTGRFILICRLSGEAVVLCREPFSFRDAPDILRPPFWVS